MKNFNDPASGFTRAEINYQKNPNDDALTGKIPVQFNPTELSRKESAVFNSPDSKEESNRSFIDTKLENFTVTLMIDETERERGDDKGIGYYLQELRKLMRPLLAYENMKMPPLCRFHWKEFTYRGFLTSLEEKYTLFKPDGAPLRVQLTATFESHKTEEEKKREDSSENSRKFWTVREGDRLDLIAARLNGDPNRWRAIAEANGIEEPSQFPGPIGETRPADPDTGRPAELGPVYVGVRLLIPDPREA